MRPDHKSVLNIPTAQQWFVWSRVKSQFLEMLHEDVANDGGERISHSHAIFLLEELVVIVVELIFDDL
jgi:hypothetical protein